MKLSSRLPFVLSLPLAVALGAACNKPEPAVAEDDDAGSAPAKELPASVPLKVAGDPQIPESEFGIEIPGDALPVSVTKDVLFLGDEQLTALGESALIPDAAWSSVFEAFNPELRGDARLYVVFADKAVRATYMSELLLLGKLSDSMRFGLARKSPGGKPLMLPIWKSYGRVEAPGVPAYRDGTPLLTLEFRGDVLSLGASGPAMLSPPVQVDAKDLAAVTVAAERLVGGHPTAHTLQVGVIGDAKLGKVLSAVDAARGCSAKTGTCRLPDVRISEANAHGDSNEPLSTGYGDALIRDIAIDGPLLNRVVRKPAAAGAQTVERCHDAGQRIDPEMGDELKITFKVDTSTELSSVELQLDEGEAAAVFSACVVKEVQSWRIATPTPAPTASSQVTVTYWLGFGM